MKLILTALAVSGLLVGCGGSSSSPSSASPAVTTTGSGATQAATIDMLETRKFAPTTIDATVGTVTFTVVNKGGTAHNLQFDDASLGKTPTVAGEESKTLKVSFGKAGTYTFLCTFHEGMTGKVVVS